MSDNDTKSRVEAVERKLEDMFGWKASYHLRVRPLSGEVALYNSDSVTCIAEALEMVINYLVKKEMANG